MTLLSSETIFILPPILSCLWTIMDWTAFTIYPFAQACQEVNSHMIGSKFLPLKIAITYPRNYDRWKGYKIEADDDSDSPD